ncbi:MAG: hypothetical protein KDA85_17140 [Planctomycetaceae bacterium]|nr:hypothetical protein [Planctomycetaceae bacterium]
MILGRCRLRDLRLEVVSWKPASPVLSWLNRDSAVAVGGRFLSLGAATPQPREGPMSDIPETSVAGLRRRKFRQFLIAPSIGERAPAKPAHILVQCGE